MGAVRFYHLTRDSTETALRQLLPRALEAGLRVEVRARTRAALEDLDTALWLGGDESFLPHGIAGGPHDALQPVLLTEATAVRQSTSCLIAIEGADVSAAEAATLERSMIIFDGTDPAALTQARQHWKSLTGDGLACEYWSQESGRWTRKA